MPEALRVAAAALPAHALERASLALLVSSTLFQFATGILNAQLYYPWKFSFLAAHFYGGWVFIAAFVLHAALKLPTMRRSLRERRLLDELRRGLDETRPETGESELIPPAPSAPTISRRGVLGLTGGASLGLLALTAGQSVGGPLREIALLAPHGRDLGSGPNDFQVNKTARVARHHARRRPAPRGVCRSPAGAARSSSRARSCWRCRSRPTSCRSPASRGGRRRRPGAACGCATWRRSRASSPSTSCSSSPCSRAAASAARRSARVRSGTAARCSRCASTAPTCRPTTASRHGSSCRRCPACTARSGSTRLAFKGTRGMRPAAGLRRRPAAPAQPRRGARAGGVRVHPDLRRRAAVERRAVVRRRAGRCTTRSRFRSTRRSTASRSGGAGRSVNHVRVPALLSALALHRLLSADPRPRRLRAAHDALAGRLPRPLAAAVRRDVRRVGAAVRRARAASPAA